MRSPIEEERRVHCRGPLRSRFAKLLAFSLLTLAELGRAVAPDPIINAMAPLFIGDPGNQLYLDDLDSGRRTAYEDEWLRFTDQLRQLKKLGIRGVSVDVWWGIVQRRGPHSFDWGYYRRIFKVIQSEGLSIKAIMSTHRCGNNLGDNVQISLPAWVFNEISEKDPGEVLFESEAGNRSHEYISYWATDRVLPFYEGFWSGFIGRFRDMSESISAIAISLGPSGELHYPAYHDHDSAYLESQWPHRGFFQGSSDLAHQDYLQFLKRRYESLQSMNATFATNYSSWDQVFFPKLMNPKVFSEKLASKWLWSQESRTLFGWYAEVLRQHAEKVLNRAALLFWRDSDFGKVPISIKIPGIHWEENRLAELMNGLVSVDDISPILADGPSRASNLGYSKLFQTVAKLQSSYPGNHFEVYTTAGSTPDDERAGNYSRGQSIVRAQAELAKSLGLTIKLENAMAGDLHSAARLEILEQNFKSTERAGVTLLRMSDVIGSPKAQLKCERWLRMAAKKRPRASVQGPAHE